MYKIYKLIEGMNSVYNSNFLIIGDTRDDYNVEIVTLDMCCNLNFMKIGYTDFIMLMEEISGGNQDLLMCYEEIEKAIDFCKRYGKTMKKAALSGSSKTLSVLK